VKDNARVRQNSGFSVLGRGDYLAPDQSGLRGGALGKQGIRSASVRKMIGKVLAWQRSLSRSGCNAVAKHSIDARTVAQAIEKVRVECSLWRIRRTHVKVIAAQIDLAGVEVLAVLLTRLRHAGTRRRRMRRLNEPRTVIPVSLKSGTARLLHYVSEKDPDLGLLANSFESMIVV